MSAMPELTEAFGTELPHEKLLIVRGPRSGLTISVAVHSTRLGQALGGCRLWSYDNWVEAVHDSLRLAVIDFYALRNNNISIWNVADTKLVDEAIHPYFRGRFRLGRRGPNDRRYATPIDYAAVAADPYFRGLLMDRVEFMRLTIPEYETSIAAARGLIAMLDRQIERLD